MAEFSTTLSADLSESDELMYVTDNTGARTTYPWRLVINDEALYVTAGVAEGLVWNVERGADDTDPAFHLAGALVSGEPVGMKGPFIEPTTATAASTVRWLIDNDFMAPGGPLTYGGVSVTFGGDAVTYGV